MSKKRISALLQLIAFLALAGILVWWKYNSIEPGDKQQMFIAFKNIRWIWMIPLFVVGFLAHLFRALRWKIIMHPLGIIPSSANAFFAVMIGYLTNTVLPRVGEVAKCTVLTKYEKAHFEKLVGTIIAERAFDMICLFLLFAITLFTQFEVLYPLAQSLLQKLSFNNHGALKWLSFVIIFILIALLIVFFIWIFKRIKNSKIKHFINGIINGLKAIAQIREKRKFLFYTLMIWIGYISMAVFGFYALPEMDGLTLWASLSIISFGSVGMIVTPGGIGAYPVIVAQVLILYGIGSGVGFAYGWVSWAGQTAVVLLYGLISLVLLPILNQKQKIKDGTEAGNN